MQRHQRISGRLEPGFLAGKKSPAAIGILRGSQPIEAGVEGVFHLRHIGGFPRFLHSYNCTAASNWKLRRVSTGTRTFFLPVKAAASVPAPAPAPAPMSAPAGPPAKAPIPAPPAAPPPMASRFRFLCDPLVRPACDVVMSYFLPFSSKESRLRLITARPLSLPEGADVSTRPEKLAFFGITIW